MLICPGGRKTVGSHLLSWKELQLGLETASGACVPGADPLGSSQSSLLHSKRLPPPPPHPHHPPPPGLCKSWSEEYIMDIAFGASFPASH